MTWMNALDLKAKDSDSVAKKNLKNRSSSILKRNLKEVAEVARMRMKRGRK